MSVALPIPGFAVIMPRDISPADYCFCHIVLPQVNQKFNTDYMTKKAGSMA